MKEAKVFNKGNNRVKEELSLLLTMIGGTLGI